MKIPRTFAIITLSSGSLFGTLCAQTVNDDKNKPAAETGDVVELSVFEVSTNRDVGYQSPNAAEVSRMNMAIEDIPMNITVFNQEFITDIMAVDLDDVVTYDASFGKSGGTERFKSRGFTVSANYIDGFRQAEGIGKYLMSSKERVEIIKGPAAVLWGQGGFGAVINSITKRPQMRQRTELLFGIESFATKRVLIDDTRPLPVGNGRQLAYRLSASWRDGDNYRHNSRKNIEIAPSLLWQPTKNTKVIASYTYALDEYQGDWASPVHAGNPHGLYTFDGVWHSYRNAPSNTNSDDLRHLERQVAYIDVQHAFSRHVQFRTQFQWEGRTRADYEVLPENEYIAVLKDAVLVPRRYRELFRDDNNFRARAELVTNFKTGPISYKILGGVAWDRVDYDEDQWYTATNRGKPNSQGPLGYKVFPNLTYADFLVNPAAADYAVTGGSVLPLNLFEPEKSPVPERSSLTLARNNRYRNVTTNNSEYYISGFFGFFNDHLLLVAGMRHTETDRTITSFATGLAAPSIDPSANTSSWGAVWHIDRAKRFTAYGNLNSSFEPNFQVDRDGKPLDPTTGDQKEIGLKFNIYKDRFQGLLCIYEINQNNVPVELPDGYYTTISNMQSKGSELSLNFRPTDSWNMIGSYAYTDAKNKLTGAPVGQQAKHAIVLTNTYEFKKGAFKGLRPLLAVFYSSGPWSDNDEVPSRVEPVWKASSFWTVNVGLAYTVRIFGKTRLKFSFLAKNVFDNHDDYKVLYANRATMEAGRSLYFNTTLLF